MSACTKKQANPELSDEIYNDLKNELELNEKQTETINSQLSKDIETYKKSVPQSGEAAINRNKVNTTENLLSVVKQQKKYFEIKIEQRKIYVSERYKESLIKNGRPWPDIKENLDYKTKMKLQREKFNWDSGNVPRGTDGKSNTSIEKGKNANKTN